MFLFFFWLIFPVLSSVNGNSHRPFEPWGLEVHSKKPRTATINWQRPDAGSYTGFWLRIYSPSTGESEGLDFNDDDDVATLRQLKPNTTYELELYTVLDDAISQYAAITTFTTPPAEPQDVFALKILETQLTIQYNTSLLPYNSNRRYIFLISPTVNNPADSFYYFLEDSIRTFDKLIPGRLYTISASTSSSMNSEVSDPKIVQFRTVPLAPTKNDDDNDKSHSSSPTSFHVSWYPPNKECDFDRYHVTVYWYGNGDDEKYKHRVTTFVAHSSIESHKFKNLPHGKKFYVYVRTVSGVGTTTEQISQPLIIPITHEDKHASENTDNPLIN